MKAFIYSLAGAVVFGVLCVAGAWCLGAIFGPLYQGEQEANRNFGYFLIAFSVSIGIGLFLGFKLSRKN
ncbi:hypothetical protein [Teredinibacter waterburyi]|uniref:hypothetical protein n=1 Tax=Teredinibacter waterburyi TaxID=1500538 RepID=UPI00165F6F4A|nr:hypothetical protein [Teredinibacter waterburyi]